MTRCYTITYLLVATAVLAQQPTGFAALDTRIYQVIDPSSTFPIIRNKTNQLFDRPNQLTAYQKEWGLSSINDKRVKLQLKQLIRRSLRPWPISVRHEPLVTFLYIDDRGKVLEVEFGVKAQTHLPLQRLTILENAIKERLVFSFADDSLKGISFIKFGLTTQLSQ